MGLGAWGAAMGRIPCRRIRQGARSASRQPLPRRTLERPGAKPPLTGLCVVGITAHRVQVLALALTLALTLALVPVPCLTPLQLLVRPAPPAA